MDDRTIEKLLRAVFIPLEASGRHVHLTRDQARSLFGHDLTPSRPLSQPGQYLAVERVTIRGPKGEFRNVAVLGPSRPAAQVEISLTDARTLGISAPIRQSGSVAGTPGIRLLGPAGEVSLPQGVMVAQRHLHLTPGDAARFGVQDKQQVRLQTFTARPLVFEEVVVRVSDRFATAAHLDFDEANACGMVSGDFGRLLP